VVYLSILPVRFKPQGLYLIYLPRFVLFIVPVVFAWTIAPLVSRMTEIDAKWGAAAIALGSLTFLAYAIDMGAHDTFTPLSYVRWAWRHPGTRVIPFDDNRAARVVDRMAGPRDRIDLDGDTQPWIYPAYGPNLTRQVTFVRPNSGSSAISADADWVVIDHGWTTWWFHPQPKAAREARPSGGRLLDELLRDPRFQLAYYDRQRNQAVFHRKR
jgi:hypothetical protein